MRALMIIDMQSAYFKDAHLARQKDRLIDRINTLIDEHESRGDLVINMRTVHQKDTSTWTLNMREDDQGFAFDGSTETEPLAGLHIDSAKDMIKTRDSAFIRTGLLEVLNEHSVNEVTITGVSAHSCILHTASDAYAYDFSVNLPVSAIGDESDEAKDHALAYLKREYRQHVIN